PDLARTHRPVRGPGNYRPQRSTPAPDYRGVGAHREPHREGQGVCPGLSPGVLLDAQGSAETGRALYFGRPAAADYRAERLAGISHAHPGRDEPAGWQVTRPAPETVRVLVCPGSGGGDDGPRLCPIWPRRAPS